MLLTVIVAFLIQSFAFSRFLVALALSSHFLNRRPSRQSVAAGGIGLLVASAAMISCVLTDLTYLKLMTTSNGSGFASA